jgi:predicted ferric reductase
VRSQAWWYVARSGGIISWALAALAVIGGLQLSTRLLRRPAPAWMLDVHRFLGGLAVAFLGVHLLGLAADQFIGFSVADFLVPFVSSYKPAAVGLGVIGMYLLLAVELTSLAMRRIPRSTWHAIHLSSYVIFVVATVHGLTAGTDRHNAVFQWACLVTAGVVLMMTLVRIMSPRRAPRPTSVAGSD